MAGGMPLVFTQEDFLVWSKILEGNYSFLWGHRNPNFRLLVTSTLSFNARVDSLTCVLCEMYSVAQPLFPLTF